MNLKYNPQNRLEKENVFRFHGHTQNFHDLVITVTVLDSYETTGEYLVLKEKRTKEDCN